MHLLLDRGADKRISSGYSTINVTETVGTYGTLGYIAPERTSGASAGCGVCISDIYRSLSINFLFFPCT